jgi:uncharacterized protein (TIGR03083 family)
MTEAIIDLLDEQWSNLDELCAPLSDEEWATPTECPGWDVHDQLAHVIGTESALSGLPTPPSPDPTPTHVVNPIGAMNEAWVESLRPLTNPQLLARFREITATRLEQLRNAPPERFDEIGPTPVGQAPYREFMNVRAMDCWVHEQDIRRAIGRPGHQTSALADHAISRFITAMPFVVGKKAGAPDGSCVEFVLTGPVTRSFAVEVVDGRARLAPDLPASGTATSTITMDAETWWTLALGRRSPADALSGGLVDLAGDVDLGRRVVDSLAFMI